MTKIKRDVNHRIQARWMKWRNGLGVLWLNGASQAQKNALPHNHKTSDVLFIECWEVKCKKSISQMLKKGECCGGWVSIQENIWNEYIWEKIRSSTYHGTEERISSEMVKQGEDQQSFRMSWSNRQ